MFCAPPSRVCVQGNPQPVPLPAITRFAPSPNGPLHLGHALAAVVAQGLGVCRLRIEDIDPERSRADLVPAILADLAWLGLSFAGAPIVQSARIAQHAAAADRLRALGLLYPCRCTRAEIAAAARAMGPEGPLYPGTCRGRDVPAEGAAWRLDMARAVALAGRLAWVDEIAGTQAARPEMFGDVVLVRRDVPTSYHLAVTLDDAADGITVVTRGADLFLASHLHRLLQALLGLPVPVWHHHALILDADGRKLAKRRGSPSLADMRAGGVEGRAVAEALRARRLDLPFMPAGLSFGAGVMEAS